MQDFTQFTPNQPQQGAYARALSSEALFFQRIYTWMVAGLALTAGVGYIFAHSAAFQSLLLSFRYSLLLVFAVQIGLVIWLSARLEQMSPSTAKMVFLAYSAVTGVTVGVCMLVYPAAAFAKAFLTTAGVYGAMAVYGLVTKRSLQAWGSFLFMGVVGIIIASLVNIFLGSNTLDLAICVIGVFLFAGLTAYDHQKLRVIHATALDGTADTEGRMVIMGALTLYLDFINLFLFLLRLFGGRGNE